MLRMADNLVRRLWKDESGVVLAVTMIVFLTLFMMAMAVYAVGDTVRLRIEVQNAADAGAYSAGVIQADCNSRVAALNRALSWTHVRMARMEMDYIVDKWLKLTLDAWDDDNDMAKQINQGGACNKGLPYYGTGKGVSLFTPFAHKRILLNGRHWETTDSIKQARSSAAAQGKDYETLAGKIDTCRTVIRQINAKEVDLINRLPGRVEKVVEAVLKGNISDTWNDSFAGGGQIMYTLRQEMAPLDNNFEILGNDQEADFLRHSNYIPDRGGDVKEVLGPGTDDWFVQKAPAGGKGIQREYRQGGMRLVAEWDWFASVWQMVKGVCVMVFQTSGSNKVRGQDGYVSDYFETETAKPQVLKKIFFAKGGSLVVGVTRRVNNPFQFMAVGGDLGVIRPFSVNNANRYMWTASAAIAGYNPNPPNDCQGQYEVTYEDNSGDKLWNLKTSDWDAELIPLHVARAKGTPGRKWDRATAGEILEDVKGGPWKPLYGEGGALGEQGAPKGMNEGAEIGYNAAEGWILH